MPDPPADAYWTLPRALSTENIASPRLGRDDNGNLHLLYLVVVNPGPGTGNLFYRKSTDHGATWSAAEAVTSADNSRQPDLAVAPNGTVHIVWIEYTGSDDDFDVKYTSGTAGNWAPAETVSPGGGLQGHPAIAVEANYAHIVWEMPYTAGNPDIFYKHKKLDTGDWEPTDGKLIEGTSISDFSPDIAVDSAGNLHLVWTENLNVLKYSYADHQYHGTDWTEPIDLAGMTNCRAPALAVGSDDYLHVTWGRRVSEDEQYLHYANSQLPPSSPLTPITPTIALTVDNEPYDLQPDITVVGSDEVHIVLNGEKEAGEEEEVYHLVSNSRGAEGSWSSLVNVSHTLSAISIAPAIAVGNDMVYIVWEEQDGSNYDLYFSASFPYGVYAPLMERNY